MTQNSDSPQPASVDASRSTLCSALLPLPISHNMFPDFSPFGRGGDWSTQPLGEILDQIQDGKEFRMICMKYNCHCEKDHA
jgi:hypothetical protein